MNKAPIPVIAIACLYLAVGAIALAFDLSHFEPRHPFSGGLPWVSLVHLLAIVSGVWMLRASNWARWLAIAWMAFHVAVSIFDAWSVLAIHALLLAIFAYFLFRPAANRYFRRAETEVSP
jgi:hypothetical protein